MSDLQAKLTAWSPRALDLLRIVAALLFIEHGTIKLFGFPPGGDPGPAMFTLIWFAGVIELVGGVLILLGLFTRAAAFLASGEMAIAYWMVHAKMGTWPAMNHGEGAILFCFIFLYLVFAGPGAWSLDAMMRRRSASA